MALVHISHSPAVAAIPEPSSAASATATAEQNPECTGLTPFYWEIGDKTGLLISGAGGNDGEPPERDSLMLIASASKWLFATYAAEQTQGQLSPLDIAYLTLDSGYSNFEEGTACSRGSTVSSCLTEPGANGGTRGDYIAETDGYFYYGGGHMQVMGASNTLLGIANNTASGLTIKVSSKLGLADDTLFFYDVPQLAGGVITNAKVYAQFLANMLSKQYPFMYQLLGADRVCAHANSSDCPTAIYSPINQSAPGAANDLSNEAWHYSPGHWIESDPLVGDGALSNIGAFGFYAWIDESKTWYGVLARQDLMATEVTARASLECGRLIREAWITGVQPSPNYPVPAVDGTFGRLLLFLGILAVLSWHRRHSRTSKTLAQ